MAGRAAGRADAAFEAARRSRYWSEAEARVVLAAYRASGLSLKAFARHTGLSARRVRGWRARMPAPLPSAGATFLPVEVVPATAPAGPALEVVVAGGHVVRVPREFDAATLTRLLAVLAGPVC
jgi:hypothetical protein